MANNDFDDLKDIIRDLTYDTNMKAFTNDDKSIVYRNTMFSNGTGVKHDLYPDVKNGDLNKPHSGYHGKVQNNEDYNIDYHNEDKSEKTSTSGSGCYLTSACLKHFKTKFDDNCKELSILRWFRDNYVPEEDIDYYYDIAPEIVNGINNNLYANDIYEYI